MKPIQIKYAGLTFRSKTEAKWALFMDLIGCKYIYEPEGYDLGDGVCYCPDFYLPDIDTFLEIKPITGGYESPTDLLAEKSGKRVILMKGTPFAGSFDDYSNNGVCYYPGGGEDSPYWFCICEQCRKVGIEFDGRSGRIGCHCPNRGDKEYNSQDSVICEAIEKCDSAFRWDKLGTQIHQKQRPLVPPIRVFATTHQKITVTSGLPDPFAALDAMIDQEV
jgi:hypothetical protein